MDPYSAEGELINIHNAFHQGQYEEVVDYDTSSLSPENQLPARILQLRARVALGQADDVIKEISGETDTEYTAVGALAEFARGNKEEAVKTVQELAESEEARDNGVVQVLGGTVLAAAGNGEEALQLLARHQGNRTFDLLPMRGMNFKCADRRGAVEAVALMVQIHLQQNRNDLAVKEVQAARRWAQDSLLVNLAESWVGLRLVRLPQSCNRRRHRNTFFFADLVSSTRAETSTNKPSTSSRSSHRHLPHRQYAHWCRKQWPSYIWAAPRRQRPRWTKP